MSGSHIGIRIADGSFYPILDKTALGRKRLTLTTVHDDQDSVQIALYQGDESQGENHGDSDMEYVGTLVIERLKPAAKGEPDIRLVVGIDEAGNLNATATDLSSGEYQSLSVSLQSIEEQSMYSMPDFSLEETADEAFTPDYTDDELSLDEDLTLDELTAAAEKDADEEPSFTMDEDGDDSTDAVSFDEDFSLDSLDSLDDFDSLDENLEQKTETAEAPAAGSHLPEADSQTTSESQTHADAFETEDFGIGDTDFGGSDFGDDMDFSFEEPDTEPEPESGRSEEYESDASEPDIYRTSRNIERKTDVPSYDEDQMRRDRPGPVLFLGFIFLALAALGFLTYIIFRAIENPNVPSLDAAMLLLVSRPLFRGVRYRKKTKR